MSDCLLCRSGITAEILAATGPENQRAYARNMLAQMRTGAADAKAYEPPGISSVERCARIAETHCGSMACSGCLACRVAAAIRAAEKRIYLEREAEIDAHQFGFMVGRLAAACCELHAPFGKLLLAEHEAERKRQAS